MPKNRIVLHVLCGRHAVRIDRGLLQIVTPLAGQIGDLKREDLPFSARDIPNGSVIEHDSGLNYFHVIDTGDDIVFVAPIPKPLAQ